MASPLFLTLSPPSLLSPKRSFSPLITNPRHLTLTRGPNPPPSYKITMDYNGSTHSLDVEPDETILQKALDEGFEVPHDCKLGVCMTCPAKLVSGTVDQSEGMLSDDVVERGYALLCVAYPRSDCHVEIIPEEELLSLQLATAND